MLLKLQFTLFQVLDGGNNEFNLPFGFEWLRSIFEYILGWHTIRKCYRK